MAQLFEPERGSYQVKIAVDGLSASVRALFLGLTS